jgi:hypothetical protein
MHDLSKALSLHTYTRSDLDRRVGLLRASLERVLFGENPVTSEEVFQKAVLAQAALESNSVRDIEVLEAWYKAVWQKLRGDTLRVFLRELEESAHALPQFELYVPVVFDEEALEEMSAWYRSEVTAYAVFVLHIDPFLVGGCGFVSKDTYREYSLESRFALHKGLITKLISSYA